MSLSEQSCEGFLNYILSSSVPLSFSSSHSFFIWCNCSAKWRRAKLDPILTDRSRNSTELELRAHLLLPWGLDGVRSEKKVLKNPFVWSQLLLTAFRPDLLVLLGCISVRNNIPYLFLSSFRDKCTSPAGQVQGKCCSMWLRKERLQNKIKSLFPQCLIATETLQFTLPFPSRAVIDTHTWNSEICSH